MSLKPLAYLILSFLGGIVFTLFVVLLLWREEKDAIREVKKLADELEELEREEGS